MSVATTSVTPNKEFRTAIEGAMELNLESEVRDYLNRLWLASPNSFDVDEVMTEFMDYMGNHFRMVWTDTRD